MIEPDPRPNRSLPASTTQKTDGSNGGESRVVVDADGNQLYGSHHYRYIGAVHIPGSWWSVTLYDQDGSLIENADERYAFTSFNAIPEDDGSIVVDIAPVRPEQALNWLPC